MNHDAHLKAAFISQMDVGPRMEAIGELQAKLEVARTALTRIVACPWDCAAPGVSCHDIAREALEKTK